MHLSQISLALTRIGRVVSDPDAAIKALFANSEQGAWYDPSDFSTMFQDSAGKTPVTAVGQPVGLILDKSKGLVLGSELNTNGTFDTDTGWTKASGATISGGTVNASANTGYWLYQVNANVSVGKYYEATFTISNYVSGTVRGYVGTTTKFGPTVSGNGTYTFRAGPVSGGERGFDSQSAFTGSIDNFSVKEVLGNHATQATSSSRPVVANNAQAKQYRNFDAVDDSMATTFASSLGSSCTVARSDPTTGAVILTGQTIGTSYSASADDCALIIINRALTGQETTDLTAWLNAKAGL